MFSVLLFILFVIGMSTTSVFCSFSIPTHFSLNYFFFFCLPSLISAVFISPYISGSISWYYLQSLFRYVGKFACHLFLFIVSFSLLLLQTGSPKYFFSSPTGRHFRHAVAWFPSMSKITKLGKKPMYVQQRNWKYDITRGEKFRKHSSRDFNLVKSLLVP